MLQGCVPVKLRFKLVLSPVQMVAVPANVVVGFGFTVMVGVPVNEFPVQFTSLTAVNEYVVVAVGLTLMVYGLKVIPEMVIGVTPSV